MNRFTQMALAVHKARFNNPYSEPREPTWPDEKDWEYACRLTKAALEAAKGDLDEVMWEALPSLGKSWHELTSTEVWNILLTAVQVEAQVSRKPPLNLVAIPQP